MDSHIKSGKKVTRYRVTIDFTVDNSNCMPPSNWNWRKLLELNDIQLRLEVLCQFLDSELKVESDLVNFNQIIPTNIKWN